MEKEREQQGEEDGKEEEEGEEERNNKDNPSRTKYKKMLKLNATKCYQNLKNGDGTNR